MILDFELYKSNHLFDKEILPSIRSINDSFSYYCEGFDSLLILEKTPLFFIFLSYIPYGHHTHLPNLEDALQNEPSYPRQSKGEWVVDEIFHINEKDANFIFEQIKKRTGGNSIIPFIKQELNNL